MIVKITVPDIGENVVSGKVAAVRIKPGDQVKVDDPVVELETDKAVVEIPSPVAGRVVQVWACEGCEMKVGDLIATVETEQGLEAPADGAEAVPEPEPEPDRMLSPRLETESRGAPPEAGTRPAAFGRSGAETGERSGDDRRPAPASPAVRRLARELGVPVASVTGTGPGGHITAEDVKAQVRKARPAASSEADAREGRPQGQPPLPDFSRWGGIDVVELDTVRRLTAEYTASCWRIIPHVTQFDKADISSLQQFMQRYAGQVAAAGGKLTLTPLLVKVCAEGLKRFSRFNTTLDVERQCLIFKHYIHIGLAVETPRGLLMPVVRNADQKSITALATEVAALADRCRQKKITASELEGATFTISNQGGIGGVGFTPIIPWPQVAILGVSRAALEPVAVDGAFQPRTLLPLSLSYDHRVIDGADAARFLRWICESLEQPMRMHL